jgi:hypothetical protein
MNSDKGSDFATLSQSVDELNSLVQREIQTSRRASRQSLFSVLVLALIVFVFVVVNTVNLRSEFTEDKIRQSLAAELQELRPAAMRELGTLGRDVLPVYAEEGRRQLSQMTPRLVTVLEQEIEAFSGDVLARVHGRLTEAERRVLAKTEIEIFKHFPGLHDPVAREKLGKRLFEVTDASVSRSIADFDKRFGAQVDRLRAAILDFDVSDANETPVELQKRFLHTWLQLLDEEILAL